MGEWIGRFYAIKPNEWRLVLRFFFYNLLFGFYVAIAYTISDTLFLNHLNSESAERLLPWVMIANALTTMGFMAIYTKWLEKISRLKLIIGIQFTFALSFLLFRFGLAYWPTTPVFFCLYLVMQASIFVLFSLLYSFLGDYFDTHTGRRVYGFISIGKGLGAIVGSMSVIFLLKFIPPIDLLYLPVFVLLILNLSSSYIYYTTIRKPTLTRSKKTSLFISDILNNKYIVLVMLIFVLSTVLYFMAYFNFLVSARASFSGKELGQFLGGFAAISGTVMLIFQLLLSSFLLNHLGVIKSLLLTPAVLFLLFIISLFSPGLWMATTILLVFVILQESLFVSASELLFLVLIPRLRLYSHALISTIITPLGRIAASFLIMILLALFPSYIYGLFLLLLASLWLLVTGIMAPHYQQMLQKSIRSLFTQGKTFFSQDYAANTKEMDDSLEIIGSKQVYFDLFKRSAPEDQVLMLDLLPHALLKEMRPDILNLVSSSHQELSAKAINMVKACGEKNDADSIYPFLRAPSPQVQQAAIEAYASLRKNEALAELKKIASPQAAAAAFTYGGEEGRLWGLQRYKEFLAHDKKRALQVIDEAKAEIFVPDLTQLLIDPDAQVRAEAVAIGGSFPYPELIPALLQNYLSDSKTRISVKKALFQMPPMGVKEVIHLYETKGYPERLQALLLRMLGKMGGDDALHFILECLSKRTSEPLFISTCRALREFVLLNTVSYAAQKQIDLAIQNLYRDTSSLKQSYQQMGQVNGPFKELFLDTLRYYSVAYLILLNLRYAATALNDVIAIFFSRDDPFSEECWNQLKLTLPTYQMKRLKELFKVPFHELPSEQVSWTDEQVDHLSHISPWLKVLIDIYWRQEMENNKNFAQVNTILLLKKVEFFKDLPANLLIELTEIVHEETFLPSEILMTEGEKGDCMYLVGSGSLSVQKNGREIAHIGAGECVGEMALIDQMPRSATVIAQEEIKTLTLYAEEFRELLQDYPEVMNNLLIILCKRLRKTIS